MDASPALRSHILGSDPSIAHSCLGLLNPTFPCAVGTNPSQYLPGRGAVKAREGMGLVHSKHSVGSVGLLIVTTFNAAAEASQSAHVASAQSSTVGGHSSQLSPWPSHHTARSLTIGPAPPKYHFKYHLQDQW